MSMTVTVECRPTNLNEAEIASKIAAAVASVLTQHGGHTEGMEHAHTIRRYPLSRGHDQWYDAGLVVSLEGYVHVDGPDIPPLKETQLDG